MFDYLTSSTPTNTPTSTETSFSSAGLNDNVKDEEVPTLEEIMLENAGKQVIEDDKEDDFFLSIFSTPSKAIETKASTKMIKVIATGEIITVADVVKRGLGVDDVTEITASATENSSATEDSSVTENSNNQVTDNEAEIYCNSSAINENSSVTEDSKVSSVGSKMVKVIATGEIITVADVVRRGLGVDDVVDVDSNSNDLSNSNKSNNSNSNSNSNQEAVTEEITPINSNKSNNSNSNKRRKVTPPAGDYLVKVGGKSVRLDEFSFTPNEDFLSILSA